MVNDSNSNMTTQQCGDAPSSVFISYAWGGGFEEKEWLRHKVVDGLRLFEYPVFWDREEDMTNHGPLDTIKNSLDVRPLVVVCICDEQYLIQAKRSGSGLAKEIEFLREISNDAQVKFILLVFESINPEDLPTPLKGKYRIDLSRFPEDGPSFCNILISAIEGRSVTEIERQKKQYLANYSLHKKITAYANEHPLRLMGTHKDGVLINNVPLRPAAWMRLSHWSSRMAEDAHDGDFHFSPENGFWTWSLSGGANSGMWALGTAIMSAWFQHKTSAADQEKLDRCGLLIAEHIISFVKEHEVLLMGSDDIIQVLLAYPDGQNAIEQLLLDEQLQGHAKMWGVFRHLIERLKQFSEQARSLFRNAH